MPTHGDTSVAPEGTSADRESTSADRVGASVAPEGLDREGRSADPKASEFHRFFPTAALAITVLAIWALTHEYRGLVYDGQIYAVQALAKLRPTLNADLFLQNTTQDEFTVFPRAYAWVISCIGLNPAALLLTALFSIWFLHAAWNLMAHLFDPDFAWLGVFLLIITGGNYGAFGVFHFLEPFLTARLPAEALIVTALAVYLRGFERTGLTLAAATLFVHPLMALPGLLVLLCMSVPWRLSLGGTAVGIAGCLAIAIAAATVPVLRHVLPIMDSDWLEVVRERSQFLFLQLWTLKDWALNARPFVCLTLTTLVLRDPRIRNLALCAMLVGATGLLIAGIANAVGPVAVLVQGQAWRWVWTTIFVSVVLLPPTARQIWSEGESGRPCAVLLVAGWSFPADIGFVLVTLALLAWLLRHHPWLQSDEVNRRVLAAISLSIFAWAVIATGTAIASLPQPSLHEQRVVSMAKAIFELRIWCVLIALPVWFWIRNCRSGAALPMLVAGAAATVSAFLFYQSSIHFRSYGSASDMSRFADWRQVIPPSSTVFVTNGHDSGSFVWFTLERNNYLSPGQSAGVVFSRATALEVRRRSEALLPLMDPIWKLLSSLRRAKSVPSASQNHRPLTPQSLVGVCHDAALNFVISPDDVGFAPIRHVHSDAYRNWNLYDCNRVRARALTS